MTKSRLRPLRELVGDVHVNDVVQFYIKRPQGNVSSKQSRKSLVGYFREYSEKSEVAFFTFTPEEPFQFQAISISFNISLYHENFGEVFVNQRRQRYTVSHYEILQKASMARSKNGK
jgi:hypothetical protein